MPIHQSGCLQSSVIVRKCILMAAKDRLSYCLSRQMEAEGWQQGVTKRCDNRFYA